ncbi:hypothetical protein NP493_636g01000 [Ridgeia piscesae]|uniref:Uncharacterized protein n=1 Tax=Ridgeia piscesae TaxID=27915 RepID=A0AAD9KU78_RIDPI|nr:hypothetical protein NP493_636g01000 [Ridgeia piscesae]
MSNLILSLPHCHQHIAILYIYIYRQYTVYT